MPEHVGANGNNIQIVELCICCCYQSFNKPKAHSCITKKWLNFRNAWYRSVLNRPPSRHDYLNAYISKYTKQYIYCSLCACETGFLTLWENQRPRVFENMCWGEYLELTMRGGGAYTETGENFIMRSFRVFAPRQILLGWSNKGQRGGRRNTDRASVGELKRRWPLGRRRRSREEIRTPTLPRNWLRCILD
jgi:hypothetical protein